MHTNNSLSIDAIQYRRMETVEDSSPFRGHALVLSVVLSVGWACPRFG